MRIGCDADLTAFENHLRSCLRCDSNACSLLKSRPYRMLRLDILRYLARPDTGQTRNPDTTVYFGGTSLVIRCAYDSPSAVDVELQWLDLYKCQSPDADQDADQDDMLCEGV